MTPSDRAKILWHVGDLMSKYADELAELESLDNGKPMAVARAADVPLAADIIQYMAGWCTKIEGKTIPLSVMYTPGVQYHSYTRPEPIGVVGQIIPWNFPLLMAAWKLAPALATGCTVVLKVAEETPLSALRLGEIMQEAGVPGGRQERGCAGDGRRSGARGVGILRRADRVREHQAGYEDHSRGDLRPGGDGDAICGDE